MNGSAGVLPQGGGRCRVPVSSSHGTPPPLLPGRDATGHGDGRGGEFHSHPRPPSRAYLRPSLAARPTVLPLLGEVDAAAFVPRSSPPDGGGEAPDSPSRMRGIGECSDLLFGGAPRPPSCSRGALSPASPGDSAVRRADGRRRLVPALRGPSSRPSRASSSPDPPPACASSLLARAGRWLPTRVSWSNPPSGLHVHPEARRRAVRGLSSQSVRVRPPLPADVVGVASSDVNLSPPRRGPGRECSRLRRVGFGSLAPTTWPSGQPPAAGRRLVPRHCSSPFGGWRIETEANATDLKSLRRAFQRARNRPNPRLASIESIAFLAELGKSDPE